MKNDVLTLKVPLGFDIWLFYSYVIGQGKMHDHINFTAEEVPSSHMPRLKLENEMEECKFSPAKMELSS